MFVAASWRPACAQQCLHRADCLTPAGLAWISYGNRGIYVTPLTTTDCVSRGYRRSLG